MVYYFRSPFQSIFFSDNNDIRTVTRGCVNATMCPDLEASGEHCMHYDQSSVGIYTTLIHVLDKGETEK